MANSAFEGFDGIKQRLESILASKADALKAAGVSILTSSQKEIIEGNPDWPGFKRPPKRAHQLLWMYGTLLRSLAIESPDNIIREEENSIVVGSNVIYANAQNRGNPDHNLPARPFLYLSNDRMKLAEAAFLAQIMKAWDR